MIIKAIAGLSALTLAGGAAHAGYYVNTEIESGFTGNDYTGSQLETRLGYEGELSDRSDFYVELGPTVTFEDDADETTELGVEVGADFAVTDNLTVYGEVEAFTGSDIETSTIVGARYSF